MEKPNPLRVQDFLLFITSQNTILTLEAEHEPTEKIFTIDLDSDSIAQITNDLFDSVDRMVQGLKDATDDKFEDLTLTISPQGKLSYLAIYSSGVIKKEFSFTLSLTEKEMEPIEVFSRRLNSVKGELEKWKGEHESKIVNVETFQTFQAKSEERFDRLENMILQMEQKMTQRLDLIERLCDNLKMLIPFQPDIYFSHESNNISKYVLSENYKTASYGGPGSHACLELLPQVHLNGRYSYSLRINTENSPITFGITAERVKTNWNGDKCSYRYHTQNGGILGGCEPKNPSASGPFGGNNKILKMIVDMDQGTLAFLLDNIPINSCSILKSDKYFAYISLGTIGDSVTLI